MEFYEEMMKISLVGHVRRAPAQRVAHTLCATTVYFYTAENGPMRRDLHPMRRVGKLTHSSGLQTLISPSTIFFSFTLVFGMQMDCLNTKNILYIMDFDF